MMATSGWQNARIKEINERLRARDRGLRALPRERAARPQRNSAVSGNTRGVVTRTNGMVPEVQRLSSHQGSCRHRQRVGKSDDAFRAHRPINAQIGSVITIEEPMSCAREQKCPHHPAARGVHNSSFKHALRAALREDPNCARGAADPRDRLDGDRHAGRATSVRHCDTSTAVSTVDASQPVHSRRQAPTA